MKRIVCMTTVVLSSMAFAISGCSGTNATEGANQAAAGANELYYLPVTAAKASSFDQTPDWAPAPDPMAPVDGDMLTRWSSGYESSAEWIYFDFGKQREVSNVIIRWEKAHATKYKIMVSDDAQNWKEVYNEENCKGNAMEASFSPVKCRYIKIQGVARVDDSWGISIWEAEFYGSQSGNTDAKISKKEYLSKGVSEAQVKEAEELVKSLNSSVTSMKDKPFQIGVVYTSWTVDELLNPASDITLAKLKQNGFDTIAIMVPTYQDTIESDNVFANDGPGGDTPSVESLKHAVEICHKIGLRVVLKMHVDPRTDEARINILPSEPWFKSYEAMVMKYAVFAQQSGVDAFSVGTELEGTTFGPWLDKWKEIIKKIRGVYKGLLTYSANWTEYQGVNFWNELDYIGIDAYFPITSKNDPTPDELIAGWNKVADEIETWLKAQNLTDKGVVFTEVGYTSTNGTNRQPWVAVTNTEDQQEQADCLEATFSVFSKRPWFKGYNLWQYMPQERWSPLGFTVNGKKAEEVVKKWNSAFAGKK